jgi:drug/metabolite transporter (DMT)-like permease
MKRLPSGIAAAVASAVLFGVSTPMAKLLVGGVSPLLLAGLLYAGSGVGLSLVRPLLRPSTDERPLEKTELPWLAGAVVAGGVLAPILLLFGLRATPASSASLLLNIEGVFTALIAWFLFRENFDARILVGFGLILSGAVVLSWEGPGRGSRGLPLGSLAVAAACLCWAIDNNLTQQVSSASATKLAAIKGLVAGSVNLMLALVTGAKLPTIRILGGAVLVGFLGYGLSLVLFVLALRHLGTARTSAYFSLAPFFGAAVSFPLLHEPVGPGFAAAGALMAIGAWLHMTESHEHEHHHGRLEHAHPHVHDAHHRHDHASNDPEGEPHTHLHVHEPITHSHPHYPDIHHRHEH